MDLQNVTRLCCGESSTFRLNIAYIFRICVIRAKTQKTRAA
jgi:hypothetical protein